MKFGIFYEHQLPRPWAEGDEQKLFHEALDQVELADRLGIDYAWEVEHHFLEEYSHSSAPEVFLAACSQRTRRIRLGHGIVLLPPGYNPPARVAERIATLDLVSHGRVDFGTGESSSLLELAGFGVPVMEDPSPIPNSTRPWLSRSRVDTRSATRAGWLVVSWMIPWARRICFVRWLAAARNTSGAEECEYSSRKWCSTSQA